MSTAAQRDSDGAGCGYLHRDYAASFAGVATPRELPQSRGWILERQIPGTNLHDAMGCYPIFACEDWKRLPADLSSLADRLVSLTLVGDPFSGCSGEELR